jgi:hypothetical protein
MKRYPSIDFLRGLAIFIMLMLHVLMHVLDIDALLAGDNINHLGIIQIILLIVLPYFGGLAGFFLMISAMGNMVSMTKHLEKGKSVNSLIKKQIVGGILIVIFAMLIEGVVGYQGALGNFFRSLDNPAGGDYSVALYRGFHFETIHTIGWCIIVNGIVHGLIAKNDGWKNGKKVIKIYIFLAVVVLALTPVMWYLGNVIVPGMPYETDPLTGQGYGYPVLGTSPFKDFIIAIFMTPLAGHPEPIFPYLAASFIGSIIGVYMTQEKKDMDPKFLGKMFYAGLAIFIIGSVGIIVNIITIMDASGFDSAINIYQRIWDHRYWTTENGVPYLGWLFQFLSLNGMGIMLNLIIIRLVEFRGKADIFAKKSTTVRRFGFVAFTVYCIQYVYYVVHFIVSSIMAEPYDNLMWGGTVITIILTLLTFHGLLLVWEKKGYIGGLEWWIGSIAHYIIPGKGRELKEGEAKPKWYQWGMLDVKNAFYEAEWLNIINADEVDHENLKESKLAIRLALTGFIFFPFSIIAYRMAKASFATEGTNKYNSKAKIIGLIGIIFFFVALTLVSTISLNMLGVAL